MIHDAFAMPTSTPAVTAYPNLIASSQHAKDNFRPTKRAFKRVPSAQENESALKKILKEYWGYAEFRDRQLDICVEVMKGNDVFVNAPTGIGKSICFQVPAITLEHGITLVITPLLALMHDQVSALRKRGISAASLNSTTKPDEAKEIKRQLSMCHPQLRLLYVTPETLFGMRYSGDFMRAHRQKQLMRLVIDEAHVIDDWGWDFRPEYIQLGKFRDTFPDIPITALTASATNETRRHICSILGIKTGQYAQFVFAVNRKNLYYEVKFRGFENLSTKIADVAQVIKKCRSETIARGRDPGVGLVYCRMKDSCFEVAKVLKRNGITAKIYHAGLREEDKESAVKEWTEGKVHCIVATIAFGMGIDKPDVRYVIHFDIPHGVEAYYQETGRAGRDGHMSRCVLYYSREDARFRRSQVEKTAEKAALTNAETDLALDVKDFQRRYTNSFKLLQSYAEAVDVCRHVAIARYFGESKIDEKDEDHLKAYCNKMCDICTNRGAVLRRACNITEGVELASQTVPATPKSDDAHVVSSSLGMPSSIAQIHGSKFLDSSSEVGDFDFDFETDELDAVSEQPIVSSVQPTAGPSRLRYAIGAKGNHRSTESDEEGYAIPFSVSDKRASTPEKAQARYPAFHKQADSVPRQIRTPLAVKSDIQRGKQPMVHPYESPVQPGEGSYAAPGAQPTNEKKRKAQHERFLSTDAVGGDGPYGYYSLTSPTPRTLPIRSQKNAFKTPFLKTPERTGLGPIMADRRARALKDLILDLRGICEQGDLADRVWVCWGKSEEDTGKERKAIVRVIAKQYEMDLARDAKHIEEYETTLGAMLKALRILDTEGGVAMLESGRLTREHGERQEVRLLIELGRKIRTCPAVPS